MKPTLFLSHSNHDDDFVRALRQALADLGEEVWIDSRQIRGGDPLWPTVQAAIEAASAYAVLVSPEALQSQWVGKELVFALDLQRSRGSKAFPVIPLTLDGAKLGVLEQLFGEEPLYIPVSSAPGGVEDALHAILVALGQRRPEDRAPQPQPPAEPLEELMLELTDLRFGDHEGVRRASARARLVYEPATPGQPRVSSAQSWRLVAPIGPIEADDLRWYLERYAIWPSGIFADRAARVERDLERWGRLLHEAAMPAECTANVLKAWAKVGERAGRRFSIYVDHTPEKGAPESEQEAAREAATALLGLPWELLHDGDAWLFQGARPIHVRRRLPNSEALDVAVVDPPVRVLLITARPEDEACRYIDHRASAIPLVEAMELLGGRVKITVLDPPTLPALRAELERARRLRAPYHVVHFDGHGVYDRRVGLGGLCFEDPDDIQKLEGRRHKTEYTSALGPLLRDHRVPLVFLEACQSATSEAASESVATELLKRGVASVVAMSHSVLVETARRFVAAFYAALSRGARVGDAMLDGQRALHEDDRRGNVLGAGELRLRDWFVPVLYQEKADPQLFATTPSERAREDLRAALKARLGAVPDPPETGFIGRSRELLTLQRLLRNDRYAVVRGQGGEGKTALAAELARWMVRSQQARRAAFVTVELHSTVPAVVHALGSQLVGKGWKPATGDGLEPAIQALEQVLAEQPTVLVLDNLESVLLPPFLSYYIGESSSQTTIRSVVAPKEQGSANTHGASPCEVPMGCGHSPALRSSEALSEEARAAADAILGLCARLLARGDTRIVFTSREALPAPFGAERNRVELRQLAREDAVALVERTLQAGSGGAGQAAKAGTEAIEEIVNAVNCHARTLALLGPALRARGVEETRGALVALMAEMDRRFPGDRERSVYASVELSLRRMSEENRRRVGVLGVFQGVVDLDVLRVMMEWEREAVGALARELVGTGLATVDPYDHLTLNPALCPYLSAGLQAEEREALTARWAGAMRGYVEFLVREDSRRAEIAATLTALELPNLFALLERVERAGGAEATIDLATSLHQLLLMAGRTRLLERVGRVREATVAALGAGWSHAASAARQTRIEQQLERRELREAFEGAQELLRKAREVGEGAYPDADYDLAMACLLFARVLRVRGRAELALPLLDEAQQRFEAVEERQPGRGAADTASACLTEKGDCLRDLGRLAESAAAYEEAIRLDERRGAERDVAVGKGQLGTVRLHQRRYPEALAAHQDARAVFMRLGEPGSVAVSWHQTGMAHQYAGQPEAAEDAYRRSLAINVQLGDLVGQANSLIQLGNLYDDALQRPEEAVAFYRQAADLYVKLGTAVGERRARNNLAMTLRELHRLDEARQEIRRAIACATSFGHASEPWKSWSILSAIETDAGNPTAAAEARQRAITSFLAYRRDGGENHDFDGRLCLAVGQALRAGDPGAATALLTTLAADPELPARLRPLVTALQAIVAGDRDPAIAADPALYYQSAAEVQLLLETLAEPPPGARQ